LFDSSETEFLGDSVPPRDLFEWEDNGAYRRVYLTYVPAGYSGVPGGGGGGVVNLSQDLE